jgi:hypothetical protein
VAHTAPAELGGSGWRVPRPERFSFFDPLQALLDGCEVVQRHDEVDPGTPVALETGARAVADTQPDVEHAFEYA